MFTINNLLRYPVEKFLNYIIISIQISRGPMKIYLKFFMSYEKIDMFFFLLRKAPT